MENYIFNPPKKFRATPPSWITRRHVSIPEERSGGTWFVFLNYYSFTCCVTRFVATRFSYGLYWLSFQSAFLQKTFGWLEFFFFFSLAYGVYVCVYVLYFSKTWRWKIAVIKSCIRSNRSVYVRVCVCVCARELLAVSHTVKKTIFSSLDETY